MTASISDIPRPIHELNYCGLLFRGEFTELAYRIKNLAVKILSTLSHHIVYAINWILTCGRVRDDELTDTAALAKLRAYEKLPSLSPNFEKSAFELAKVWLTDDEREDIRSSLDLLLFAQIVIRASMLAGRAPRYPESINRGAAVTTFRNRCIDLSTQFDHLLPSDKIAILNHLDSEIVTHEENGETTHQLRSPIEKTTRPFIPPTATISEEAKALWTAYKNLAARSIQMRHPLMKGLSKIRWE